ncbi:MAG: prolyl aminopeptidase [Rhodospirillaceae bacterium]|nr:prolyl aminopeptidase [Rhodospirillaceae bacterium]MBT6204829.1 prolyl aminopeptidase [Rhodospirillaceae bacterium]MBT6509178.1 prolyl aminopeptidase [Rhodospirillaceae bacterium]MBT7613797.1 prolyl aminopeptidase [Rhodospirillaceae bacterium]MBT7646761.1 prolyl aminopeptidase [Rhodospirillaceae bacterium]
MRDLYPLSKRFDIRHVPVDDVHTLHVEQSGNPDGVPVVLVHGGPGAPWSRHNLRVFDPEHYWVIAFDQRGSWRSTPHGELKDDTTPHLVADMERLRELFGLERWIVFGGSWGSTLSLAYAEIHPERCAGLVLRGISLGRTMENQWGFHHSRQIRPQAWDALVASIPEDERGDLDGALMRRMLDPDPAVHWPVIKGWMDQAEELGRSRHPDLELDEEDLDTPETDVVCARISITYFANDIFLPRNSLLDNAHRLAGIPGAIIHGEDDFNCPLANARDLHKAWPQARYRPIRDAGHSALDRNIRLALVETMNDFKTLEVEQS